MTTNYLVLGRNKALWPKEIIKAFNSYSNQRRRCNSKKNTHYKWYGEKGIKVEYSWREFLDWFLKNWDKSDLSKLSVGRIDHSKNYSINNIELITKSENSKERQRRCGHSIKPKKVLVFNKQGTLLAVAKHSKHAIELTGLAKNTAKRMLKKETIKSRQQYVLEYLGGVS